MKKSLLVVGLGLLSVLSCVESNYKFVSREIKEKRGNAFLELSYLNVEGNSEFAEKFNEKMTYSQGYVDEFFEDAEYISEKSQTDIEVYMKSYDSMFYYSPLLVCVKTEEESFEGGNHPNYSTIFHNFDGKTGQKLFTEELFSDKDAVTEIAEKYFRDHFNMTDDQDINNNGQFTFESGFTLAENIGISSNELLLVYNTTEIAPHSQGTIRISIPISEVKKYLKYY